MSQRGPGTGTKLLLAGATVLAGAAALVARQRRAAENAHPPRGDLLTIDGVRLHYLERGRGRPVVFLHGNGVSAEDFEVSGLLGAAATRHRAIAIDRPGFGYSKRSWAQQWSAKAQAALIHKMLQALGAEKPIIVGHSWGCLVALGLALDYPDDVTGLVLISGYYYPTARMDTALFSPVAIPLVGDVMRYTLLPLMGKAIAPGLVKKMFAPQSVPAAFSERVPISLMTRPSQIRAAAEDAAHMTTSAFALSKRYGEISCPLTILAGDADTIVEPKKQALRLHREVPASTLVMCEGAGHMLHHTNLQRVMAAIDGIALTRDVESHRAMHM